VARYLPDLVVVGLANTTISLLESHNLLICGVWACENGLHHDLYGISRSVRKYSKVSKPNFRAYESEVNVGKTQK
jgi:hypothetical protein